MENMQTSMTLKHGKNGYKYKIPNTKKGAARTWQAVYARTASEAKKLAFIKARGISRVMWGINANTIGVEIPKEITKLAAKMDPSKIKTSLNEIAFEGEGTDTQSIVTTNKVKEIEAYASTAMGEAEPIAKRYMDRLIKLEMKKRKDV